MRNFESGSFDFYSNREKPSGGERERASFKIMNGLIMAKILMMTS